MIWDMEREFSPDIIRLEISGPGLFMIRLPGQPFVENQYIYLLIDLNQEPGAIWAVACITKVVRIVRKSFHSFIVVTIAMI